MMKKLSKITSLMKIFGCISIIILSICDAYAGVKCGDKVCDDGVKCYVKEYSSIRGKGKYYTCTNTPPEIHEWEKGKVYEKTSSDDNVSYSTEYDGLAGDRTITKDEDGTLHYDYGGSGAYELDDPRSNKSCHIDDLTEKYMKNCYSCVIVSALINTFMRITYEEKMQKLMKDAGVKLLVIGMFLWIAFYILKKLSSFTSLEPMKMLQELFTFFFKCVVAFAFISSGLKIISEYFVNPVLIAGADYGIGIIDSVMPENITISGKTKTYDKDDKINLVAKAAIDQKVFDKIMTISKKADAATSLNFVIGNALICHSTHAGAIQLFKKITEMLGFKLFIPDFWLMLAGALIWFFAFMVTMAVNFYLLDLSFKIGFALLALPVCIGLWPFEKFKDKFVICLKIIINAAGTFLFLGITTGLSIVLISASLRGTEQLLDHIKNNNSRAVSSIFGFTSGAFLLVLFAYLYSHKLISKTVSQLTDKFFDSKMNGLNPIHKKTTQAIDFVKKQAGNVAGMVANPVKGGMTDMLKGGATKLARGAIDKVRNGLSGNGD